MLVREPLHRKEKSRVSSSSLNQHFRPASLTLHLKYHHCLLPPSVRFPLRMNRVREESAGRGISDPPSESRCLLPLPRHSSVPKGGYLKLCACLNLNLNMWFIEGAANTSTQKVLWPQSPAQTPGLSPLLGSLWGLSCKSLVISRTECDD